MAYESYVGVNGSMREIGGSEVGVDGATRQVALGYVGVNGEVCRVPGVAPISYYLGRVQSLEAYDISTGDLISTTKEYQDDDAVVYINRRNNGEHIGTLLCGSYGSSVGLEVYEHTKIVLKEIIYAITHLADTQTPVIPRLQLPLDAMEDRFGISYTAHTSPYSAIYNSSTRISVYTLNGDLVASGSLFSDDIDFELDGGGFILEVENDTSNNRSYYNLKGYAYESSNARLINRADFIFDNEGF